MGRRIYTTEGGRKGRRMRAASAEGWPRRETQGNGAGPPTLSAEKTERPATNRRDELIEGGAYVDPGRLWGRRPFGRAERVREAGLPVIKSRHANEWLGKPMRGSGGGILGVR